MSNPSRQEIVERICAELEEFNTNSIALDAETDIATDLNIDSVAIMDLIFALEEEYDISIPVNDLADITRVRELAALVDREIGSRP